MPSSPESLHALIEDPIVSHVGAFRDQWQIISTEACRILQLVAVLVDATDRQIVTHTVLRGVFPHGSFGASETNFMNRPLAGSVFPGNGIRLQKQTLLNGLIDS